MSVSDLIKSAMDKDAESFETSFDGIMADKMTSAIETKFDTMFGASANSAEVNIEAETE